MSPFRRGAGLALGTLLGAAVLGVAPASAAVFSTSARACNVDSDPNAAAPVSSADSCSVAFGDFGAQSFATFGSVGASARANTFSGTFQGGNTSAFASFQDIIRLQKTDPNAPDLLATALNLTFSGSLMADVAGPTHGASSAYQFALVTPAGAFRGAGSLHSAFGLSVTPSGLGDVAGVIRPGAFSVDLVTPTFMVDFAGRGFADVEIAFSVLAEAAASGFGTGEADFGHTLEFASGDVFDLPEGYTANAGAYLVGNRFVGPNAVVPEPSAWAVMILGFGLAGTAVRSRRRRGRAGGLVVPVAGPAAAVLALGASSASAASFFVQSVTDCQGTIQTSGAPMSFTRACNLGHAGVGTSVRAVYGEAGAATSVLNSRDGGAGGIAEATSQFEVYITKTDPNAPDLFMASMNLHLSGALLVTNGSGFFLPQQNTAAIRYSSTSVFGGFNGLSSIDGNGPTVFAPSGLGESRPLGDFSFNLTTPEVLLSFNGQDRLELVIGFGVTSGAFQGNGNGRSLADISNTFGFVTGGPVFNLPAGYTANAGDFLVDNRFVGPNAVVPEPSAWTLMIAGFGLAGATLRARRLRMA